MEHIIVEKFTSVPSKWMRAYVATDLEDALKKHLASKGLPAVTVYQWKAMFYVDVDAKTEGVK
jgi:hypothetical protein